MARPKKVEKTGKVIYLPSIYDPKKVREGIREILSLVEIKELSDKAKSDTLQEE